MHGLLEGALEEHMGRLRGMTQRIADKAAADARFKELQHLEEVSPPPLQSPGLPSPGSSGMYAYPLLQTSLLQSVLKGMLCFPVLVAERGLRTIKRSIWLQQHPRMRISAAKRAGSL